MSAQQGLGAPAICLMGPTASGKTDLAMALVARFPLEIISVDSAMIYRGMDIGTAKPTAEEQALAPHRLIDLLEPEQAYSAARFRTDALREVQAVREAGRVPLLVGGTLLYFRALSEGLSQLPEADAGVRARLSQLAQAEGLATLHQRLAEVDPAAAARIHPNDPQRIQRALEVWELTGQPLSRLQNRSRERIRSQALCIALEPADRALLHQRIEQRFRDMLDRGFIDEVRRLRERPELSLELPSMRAVGYRQVWQYLDGEVCYDDMLQRGISATRQLAKRQLTWLRGDETLVRYTIESLDRADLFRQVEAYLDAQAGRGGVR